MSELFSDADKATQLPADQQNPSPFTALVGESGKYKTPDDLAKAYIHADTFIEQLKAENAELRTKTQEAKTLDDVLEQLQRKQQPTAEDSLQSLDASTVAEIVKQQITGMETAKIRQTNLAKADAAMKEQFGEKALEIYNKKATTPELKKIYKELAEVDPDQFVALFGVGQQQAPQGSVDTPSVNSAGSFGAPRVKEWSKEWVAKVRKENPTLYKSPQFQVDLMKNADKYFG